MSTSPDPLEDLRNALEELAARAREAGVEIELASEMSRLARELEARQRPEPMEPEEPLGLDWDDGDDEQGESAGGDAGDEGERG